MFEDYNIKDYQGIFFLIIFFKISVILKTFLDKNKNVCYYIYITGDKGAIDMFYKILQQTSTETLKYMLNNRNQKDFTYDEIAGKMAEIFFKKNEMEITADFDQTRDYEKKEYEGMTFKQCAIKDIKNFILSMFPKRNLNKNFDEKDLIDITRRELGRNFDFENALLTELTEMADTVSESLRNLIEEEPEDEEDKLPFSDKRIEQEINFCYNDIALPEEETKKIIETLKESLYIYYKDSYDEWLSEAADHTYESLSETAGPFTDEEIEKETENFFDISVLDKNNRKKLIELIRFKLGA